MLRAVARHVGRWNSKRIGSADTIHGVIFDMVLTCPIVGRGVLRMVPLMPSVIGPLMNWVSCRMEL